MEKIKLTVKEREAGTPNQLRREAKIPATLYGQGETSKNLQVDEKELLHLPAAAFSHIVELDFGSGAPTNVLIRHVQRHAASNKLLNVEFYKVKMDHKITVVVPLQFVGTAPGVIKGGQLIESHVEAEIECLPADIPDFIEVDLSKLEEIDDAIHFGELQLPKGVEILNEAEDVVAKIIEIREIVEEEPAAEATAETTTTAAAEGGEAAPATAEKAAPAAKEK